MSSLHANNECVADKAVTSVSLSVCPGRLLKVPVSVGDRLRVEHGLLWYTIDGRLDDFFIEAGESEIITETLTLSVTGFGKTDFTLSSARPYPRFVRRGGVRPYARRRVLREAASALVAWLRAAGAGSLYGRRVAG